MKSILLLTENWNLFPARDLQSLVNAARIAEEAGIDGVQLSEHIVLGPAANEGEPKRNYREYDGLGNQPPATPWPSSLLVLSAIAAVTTRLNLFAGAILPVLRHPLQVAKDLATLDLLSKGRLVAYPTVSWHEQEYIALGKDFRKRGKMLDEQFEIWRKVWTESPASYSGEFYKFDNIYVDPKPWTPGGPPLWITGGPLHPAAIRRIAKYGSGYAPGGPMAPGEKEQIYAALTAAGRDPKYFDIMGGIMGKFEGADDVADLDETCERQLPFNMESGAAWVVAKPSQFINRAEEFPDFCRRYVKHIKALS
jgi:probable F420-dependent oxidoreductase